MECKCSDMPEPCDDCAREIHESWHARGWFWVRSEMCHDKCPGVQPTPHEADELDAAQNEYLQSQEVEWWNRK